MKVAVISSSPLVAKGTDYYAYSPYVKELNIWAGYAGEVAFMCPIWDTDRGLLISKIDFPVAKLFPAKAFNIKSFSGIVKAIGHSFGNFRKIYQAMRWSDHIHLRCPGNIGLMGCLVQILFPRKPKTAKYAGNWDPKARQPRSYKLQKWILSNTFLTRNMQVLVYGEWPGSSKNIRPFFTASYLESEKAPVEARNLEGRIAFVFIGTLATGKRALYAIQLVEALYRSGIDVHLSLYGHGREKENLQQYIIQNRLERTVSIEGNHPQETIKKAYKQSHFVLLPSKSEGWPKAIAEGMFWGCVPIASRVSCLPYMLANGKRGVLLKMDLERDVAQIVSLLRRPDDYAFKVRQSVAWSRKYTLDLFANEIKAVMHS